MKQATIDGINAALDYAKEKHGAKWIGELPLEQRGSEDTATLISLVAVAEKLAYDMLAERPTRTSVLMLMSEVAEASYNAYWGNRELARAALLQVAAMAAQWAEDLEGDGR
jgi:hypothetical protein